METLRWIGMMLAAINGADSASPPKATVIELRLTASALPTPALKYRLLPRFIDKSPGNAAPVYLRAMQYMAESQTLVPETYEKFTRGLSLSPNELRADGAARQVVQNFQKPYELIAMGARKEHADWESLIHENKDIFTIPLPHIQAARHVVRLVALKARLEMADGQFDQAVDTLSVATALCRHVSKEPFLIANLSARSGFSLVLNTIEWGMALPGSQNLYWALTSLPQPLLEWYDAADVETDNIYFYFPELRLRRREQASDEAWSASYDRFLAMTKDHEALRLEEKLKLLADMAPQQILEEAASVARERLRKRGHNDASIAVMPLKKLAMLDAIEQFDDLRDEYIKTVGLPYWQAASFFPAIEERLRNESANGSKLSQAMCGLIASWTAVRKAEIRTERQVAMLRCVEAIRHYAATHGNQLPAKLDDIQDAPIPLDPATNQPFEYSLGPDGAAVLKSKPVGDETDYRIYRLK